MIITGDKAEIRSIRRADRYQTCGLVPTMGFLHEGHLSLVRAARGENETVAVSLFVNPAQFAPEEDLDTYPRDQERDIQLLRDEKVDILFIPDDVTMYPPGFQTKVTVTEVTQPLEGIARPAHFQGVTTIVAKLLNIFQPNRVYFGQKDAQQNIMIRRMVEDLNFDLTVVVCPTIREADGLAMSSRNILLSAKDRLAAPIIYRSLVETADRVHAGQRNADSLRRFLVDIISSDPRAKIGYVSAADPETLQELAIVEDGVLLSAAVFFGRTRLIDNLLVTDIDHR